MSNHSFRFDDKQQFQLDAIASVVDLFDGQPRDAERLVTTLRAGTTADGLGMLPGLDEIGAIGNNLVLDRDTILQNLQRIQDRNGLEVSPALHDKKDLDFDIEMETGTGKTYVYLRTIFELAAKYNFTKFIILVPSVAIREGVNTSIRLMRKHFEDMYKPQGITFDSSVYSGKNAEEVQSFATATNVQILVMTIDSVRGKANTLIMHQNRDKLNGLKPIDYLKATHPVVIMDEPQNMESELSGSAIENLEPAFTLRYSATHKKQRNVVYRLDPVDAHDLNLVKQIVVADVQQQGADATPYVKLVEVKKDLSAVKLELSCRKADGSLERQVKNVQMKQELSDTRITGNPAYEGWRVTEMTMATDSSPGFIELIPNGFLNEGESLGANTGAIYKEMIRETIREHFRKELQLRDKDIKVLSLFFVDKVARYMGDGTSNEDANGDFAKWFDEVFIEERNREAQRNPRILELLPQHPSELRRAYFSKLARGQKESTEPRASDNDAFELIMKNKERLLDENEPVRFIFSHSALREGWDNPNVFQICTLREMGAETERRQTIGRGLRLPVANTGHGYERVADRGIATLTVIANESYQAFANSLQKEYREAGVEIGRVRKNEFSKISEMDDNGAMTDEFLGYNRSVDIYNHLQAKGFIDAYGSVTALFQPLTLGFSLHLPEEYKLYEEPIIERMIEANIGTYVKPKSKRAERRFNKALTLTPEFEEFWEAISKKTTYRVTIDHQQLIDEAIKAIRDAHPVEPLRIEVTKAAIKVKRGGPKGQETGQRATDLRGSYDLPDIVSELVDATNLTRQTVIDILVSSKRLPEFIGNPNDFITMVKRAIINTLAAIVGEGIQYQKIAGSVYELRELQKDGQEEKDRFLDQMYKVQNQQKTDFDYVVYDSDVERQFAELLDSREDIKLFMKLPSKFLIPTPVGPYNPDWAIIKHEDGQDRIYMIRETKSTLDLDKLRPTEKAKINFGRQHFAAIGIPDYEVSAPGHWNL